MANKKGPEDIFAPGGLFGNSEVQIDNCNGGLNSDGDGLSDCASDESHQPVTQYKVNERGRHFKAGHLADIVNKSPYLQKLQRRGKELMEVLEQTDPSAEDDE